MKSHVDDIVLQGIEFWSNVCEEETGLALEAEEVCPDTHLSNTILVFRQPRKVEHPIKFHVITPWELCLISFHCSPKL